MILDDEKNQNLLKISQKFYGHFDFVSSRPINTYYPRNIYIFKLLKLQATGSTPDKIKSNCIHDVAQQIIRGSYVQ